MPPATLLRSHFCWCRTFPFIFQFPPHRITQFSFDASSWTYSMISIMFRLFGRLLCVAVNQKNGKKIGEWMVEKKNKLLSRRRWMDEVERSEEGRVRVCRETLMKNWIHEWINCCLLCFEITIRTLRVACWNDDGTERISTNEQNRIQHKAKWEMPEARVKLNNTKQWIRIQ